MSYLPHSLIMFLRLGRIGTVAKSNQDKSLGIRTPKRRRPPTEAALFALTLNARHATSDETGWMRCVTGGLKPQVSLARLRTGARKPARNCQVVTFLPAFPASKTCRGKERQRE